MKSSDFLLAIEACWDAVRKRHPEVPNVVLILASGEERGQLVKYGHFAPLAWRQGKGGRLSEVLVSGEALDRAPEDIVGTVVHEAVHALAAARKVQDTSRQGRYHNKAFKALAEEVGLSVTQLDGYGWARTKMTTEATTTYAACIKRVGSIDRAVRRFGSGAGAKGTEDGEDGDKDAGDEDGKKPTSRALLAECSCASPRKLRVARKTMDAGPILCGLCGEPFTLTE